MLMNKLYQQETTCGPKQTSLFVSCFGKHWQSILLSRDVIHVRCPQQTNPGSQADKQRRHWEELGSGVVAAGVGSLAADDYLWNCSAGTAGSCERTTAH